ncbi:MAG TPA: hypothetical protein VFU30_10125 [Gaiellaceae bacterium]|nr:hypothetical protein [Gaiellaceae bacterium]
MKIRIVPEPPQTPQGVDVLLTVEEADLLLQSLQLWAEDVRAGKIDPGWHTHLDRDPDAPELTIAVVR